MTEKKRIFGTDGIRGQVGVTPMTATFVMRLGWAAGRFFARHPRRTLLIGKDTRISGYMFEAALEAGLSAAGANTWFVGPMPTPGVAYLTRAFRLSAGIVISASHNHYHDNGIKFFSGQGHKLGTAEEQDIERLVEQEPQTVAAEHIGKASRIHDARGRYIEFCKSCFSSGLSLDGIKLVVDCANGSCYDIAPRVFEELGARVHVIGCQPDGLNINHHCGATSPQTMARLVVEQGADAGIALDGDGDRLIMADHQGNIVRGDALLYMLACAEQDKGSLNGGVVGTLASNIGLELALKERKIAFYRASIGDRFVYQALQQHKWSIGGEPSGHLLCLRRTTTGDGIISALQILAAMCRRQLPLQDLLGGLVLQPQQEYNLPLRRGIKGDPEQHKEILATLAQSRKLLGKDGRILLRCSGTEPLLRLLVEGPRAEQIAHITEQLADTLRRILAAQGWLGEN